MSEYPSMSHVQHITFEGNDCVVMSPEEYGAALADLEAKDYELSTLRAELTEARRQLAAQPAVPEAVADELLSFMTHAGFSVSAGDEQRIRAILSATDSEVKK